MERDKVRTDGATFSNMIELINPRKTRHKQSEYCRCHKFSSIRERDTQLSKDGLRLMIKEQNCHCIACHHDAYLGRKIIIKSRMRLRCST